MRFETSITIDHTSGFGAVAKWVEALHGHGQLTSAIDYLREVSKSDVAVVLRFATDNPVPKKISIADPTDSNLISRRRTTFAHDVFGDYLDVMKAGAFILFSELEREGALTMSEQMHIRRYLTQHALNDIGIVRLSAGDKQSDYIEFHSAAAMPEANAALLTAISGT